MNIYLKVKDYIMLKYPDVITEYNEWLIANGNNTLFRRCKAYFYLLGLLMGGKYVKGRIKKSEYEDCRRLDVKKMVTEIMKYDVVSFDVFDTLILRNVEKYFDIFRITGTKIKMAGFSEIREKAEYNLSLEGTYTIFDIYRELSKRYGIGLEGIDREIDVELACCQANPYIMQIYQTAIGAGKIVIATSDMYLPKEYINKILQNCGYERFDDIIVSCDKNAEKRNGELFRWLRTEKYAHKKIIHIGDNYKADVYQARNAGIKAIQYVSVHEQGKKYRFKENGKTALGISIANAIINNEIHNGISHMGLYEQYGFIYGGSLVTGYCHFINHTAREKGMDKLLFLARDAHVIHNVYNMYYNEFENDYVYVSRRAAAQLAFGKYPHYFIEQVLNLRMMEKEKKLKIEQVLEESGLQCLVKRLVEKGLSKNDIFKEKHKKNIEELIYQYRMDILETFEIVRKGAFSYWKKIIGNAHNIALVDIGWQGSTMVCLDYFLNDVCKFDVNLQTIQLGTVRTKWNENYLDEDKISSYCFSSDFNKKINNLFSYNAERKRMVEMLFSAPHPTLMGYTANENGKEILVFAEGAKENMVMIDEMQQGILKFAEKYSDMERKLENLYPIPGEFAFLPLFDVSNNAKYMRRLFGNYVYSNISGNV